MPNHLYGILILTPPVGARHGVPETRENRVPTVAHHGAPLPHAGRIWQGNDYEHVIRDEVNWDRIPRHIETNPTNWHADEENPGRAAL